MSRCESGSQSPTENKDSASLDVEQKYTNAHTWNILGVRQ